MSGENALEPIWISDSDADENERDRVAPSETLQGDSDLEGDLEGLDLENVDEDGAGFYDIHEANTLGHDDDPHQLVSDDFPTTIEVPSVSLDWGTVRIGDFVELYDNHNEIRPDRRNDFLIIHKILEDVESGKQYLKGHRLRRVSYYAPLFDCKLNELVVVLETDRYDTRPASIQGLETVPIEHAMKRREVTFTSQPFADVSILNREVLIPVRLQANRKKTHLWVHNNGPLFARWVYIAINESNRKKYGGEIRRIYRREQVYYNALSRPAPAATRDEDDDCVMLDDCSSVTGPQRPGISSIPKQLTFADFFSGIGGASYGAKEAGLYVNFGLEKDDKVMQSYAKNHPRAWALCMDAHDFPSISCPKNFFSDLLHFSTICKFFAICHTRDGKDDQMNLETIHTVGPILGALQPPHATAEQAPGMLLLAKHQQYFRKFMSEILAHGYNIRFQVVDLATLGVPQPRRRLLFNMAKIGYPLAPFPQATHGPEGSGLKRFVTVKDALYDLERSRQFDDEFHNLPRYFSGSQTKPPYDPNLTLVKGTLTTSGGDNNYHYSGLRKFTARENACFQTFPLEADLGGTHTFANMVVGNAYPVAGAAQHILSNAQTREAFDHGLIDAEEDIQDLWVTLHENGIDPTTGGPYRYLNRLEKSKKNLGYVPRSVWAKQSVEPLRPRPRGNPPRVVDHAKARQRREVLEEARDAEYMGAMVTIEDD